LLVLLLVNSGSSLAAYDIAEYRRILKEVKLLNRASRRFLRQSKRTAGDHPLTWEAQRFRRQVKYFRGGFGLLGVYRRYRSLNSIRRDFVRVGRAGYSLMRTMQRVYKTVPDKTLRRRYVRLIYRFRRLEAMLGFR